MKKQRHPQRRRNTALARNKHLFHITYGCSPSGRNYDHAFNCGQGVMDKRARRLFGLGAEEGLISTFLKRIKSKVKK